MTYQVSEIAFEVSLRLQTFQKLVSCKKSQRFPSASLKTENFWKDKQRNLKAISLLIRCLFLFSLFVILLNRPSTDFH